MTDHGFRARLAYDHAAGEYRDGALRYMLIRPEALMGLIAELPEAARPAAFEAFARALHRVGGGSARTYRAAGAATPAALLATIAATAPQLGWGRWEIARDGAGLTVTVRNSPFAAGAGPSAGPSAGPFAGPVCAPIRGMLRAVGEMALGTPVVTEETTCAAAGAPCCRFTVTPAARPA